MVSRDTFFVLSVVALTLLLVWPVGRLIWVLSVRRLQKRLARPLEAAELAGQKKRAYLVAVFVCLAFSLIYHLSVLAWGPHG